MKKLPFEVRRWLPDITLEPLDLVFARHHAQGKEITIVQVGACDGTNNDPIHRYIAKGRTKSILIEPNPFAFARLQKKYAGVPNVMLLQTAIADQDGEICMYRVRKTDIADSEVDLTLQISSFDLKHLKRHGKKPREIEKITVQCRTLSSLISELGLTKIDLLQIDAEGFDANVVRMALKMPVQIDCINFEHIHLCKADRLPLFELLKAKGYLLGYDAWNILAVRDPQDQLMLSAADNIRTDNLVR